MMTRSSFNNNTLVGRVKKFAVDKNINLLQYVFNDSYRSHVKKASLKSRPKSSGLIDSIRFIINKVYVFLCMNVYHFCDANKILLLLLLLLLLYRFHNNLPRSIISIM